MSIEMLLLNAWSLVARLSIAIINIFIKRKVHVGSGIGMVQVIIIDHMMSWACDKAACYGSYTSYPSSWDKKKKNPHRSKLRKEGGFGCVLRARTTRAAEAQSSWSHCSLEAEREEHWYPSHFVFFYSTHGMVPHSSHSRSLPLPAAGECLQLLLLCMAHS